MGQQDNKPNNETSVDGKPLHNQPTLLTQPTKEYIKAYTRDDDPLLSESERGNTRGDLLNEKLEEKSEGVSHPITKP